MFTVPIDEVSADLIQDLIGIPESHYLEFKETLPAENPQHRSDAWFNEPEQHRPRGGPEDYAKEGVFREVCGFANSDGGWLVIGIEESEDRPRCAVRVRELPDCHELAERLQRAAHDWLDPPIPSLRFRGVGFGGRPGSGIVVCRIPRSIQAPHRLNKSRRTQEAFRRIDDETRVIRMTEIKELAFARATEKTRIDYQFEKARQIYAEIRPHRVDVARTVGLQAIGVPVTNQITLERPFRHRELFVRAPEVVGWLGPNACLSLKTLEEGRAGTSSLRPRLRGGQFEWCVTGTSGGFGQPESQFQDFGSVDIFDDGTVSLTSKTTYPKPGISVRAVLADVSNVLSTIDRVRATAGVPDTEYALEIDIRWDDHLLHQIKSINDNIQFGLLEDEVNYRGIVHVPIRLPRYTIFDRQNFYSILDKVLEDTYNMLGREHPKFTFQVPI